MLFDALAEFREQVKEDGWTDAAYVAEMNRLFKLPSHKIYSQSSFVIYRDQFRSRDGKQDGVETVSELWK
jgi:hypothetical protein